MKLSFSTSLLLTLLLGCQSVTSAETTGNLRGGGTNSTAAAEGNHHRRLLANPGETCRYNSDCESNYCTGENLNQNGFCVTQLEVESKRINPGAWIAPLNLVHLAGCHNCYQPDNAKEFNNYRWVARGIPALELDVKMCDGDWVVGHDDCNDNNRFFRDLDDYFREILYTLGDDKFQFPIIFVLSISIVTIFSPSTSPSK